MPTTPTEAPPDDVWELPFANWQPTLISEAPSWLAPYLQSANGVVDIRLTSPSQPELFYRFKQRAVALSRTPFLLCDHHPRHEISLEGIIGYLRFGFVPPPLTLWRSIHALSFGWTLTASELGPHLQSTVPLRRFAEHSAPFDVSLLYDLISVAVSRCIGSVNHCGISLSSGIDSCALAEVARTHCRLRAYTFDFTDPGAETERQEAMRIASHLGIETTVVHSAPGRFFALLPEIMHALTLPTADPVLVPQFLIAEAAIQSGDQALITGDSAEGLFGEYYFQTDRTDPRERWSHDHATWFGYPFQCSTQQVMALLSPQVHQDGKEILAVEARRWKADRLDRRSDLLEAGASFDSLFWLPGNVWRRARAVSSLLNVDILYPFHTLASLPEAGPVLNAIPRPLLWSCSKPALRSAMQSNLGEYANAPKRAFTVPIRQWIAMNPGWADRSLAALPEETNDLIRPFALSDLTNEGFTPRIIYLLCCLSFFLSRAKQGSDKE